MGSYRRVLNMDRWFGKVAIVTGASSGIGAAIAQKLVECGLQVVGLARRVERVEEAARKLEGHSGKLYAYEADVTKEDDLLKAFGWISENLGPVHVLVNNAGVVKEGSLMSGDTDKWRAVLDTNLLGLCVATRESVQSMIDNNVDGHIVQINSTTGHYVMSQANVYSASKFALTNLTEGLRTELRNAKTKIKVTSVSPGLVDTEMIRVDGEVKDIFKPMPKLNPVDVADAVVYTLSTPPHVQVHEITVRPLGEII